MRQLRAFLQRLGGFFRKLRRDDELSAELETHLQMHIADNLRRGMSADEARRQAMLHLGGLEQTKQQYRERRGLPPLENCFRELRFAARMLRKNPGFTAVVVFTLALGVGANTAIFSVLESQLWRPLPFPESERLVDVHVVLKSNARQWDVLPGTVFRAWQEQSHSFAKMGAYGYPEAHNLTAGGTSERVGVMRIGSTLLDTLQLPVAHGRGFLADEETLGRDHVAILSNAAWRDRFSSDPDILGKAVAIDGQPYIVIGIASARLHFEYVHEPAAFLPLTLGSSAEVLRNTYVIGRLAPGVTGELARAELDGILQRQQKSEGVKQEDRAEVTNLRETWTSFAARGLYFFAGAILLVLLIACVNNTGLLLARGLARQREFALRATLGASRIALIRQSLAESLLLSVAGGAAGTLLGLWGAPAFRLFSGDSLPRQTETSLDVRVLLFVLGVTVFATMTMGLMPAFFSSRVDVNEALRKGASGLSAGRSQHRARAILVGVEVCLALVLLFGAGLFLTSFVREQQAPRGFDAPGALTFGISLRGENYAKPEQQQRYFQALLSQLRSLPGVDAATLGSGIPLNPSQLYASANIAGRPPKHEHGTALTLYAVEPTFFDVLHLRMLAGRALNVHDTEASPHIAIINRNAAQSLFGSEDPLGKMLEYVPDERRGVPAEAPALIVGVAENTQQFGANEVPFDVIYVPFSQHATSSVDVVISSPLPRGALLGAIRDAAYAQDRDQPIFDIKTMDDRIADSVRGSRFDLILVGCLAAVAVALVSVGIFGTVAYFVQRRTQEFGVRLALGATPVLVLRQVVGRAFTTASIGLLLGVAVSLALGRILGSALYLVPHEHTGMLYKVKIYDPLSMAVACGLLLLAVVLASLIPARRAMRLDPMVALRYE